MSDPKHRHESMRTADKRAELRAVREWYRAHRPDAQQLAGTKPFAPPVTLDGYVAGRRVVLMLAQHRAAAGLSLADVAERTGIDVPTLGRLEDGTIENPTIDLLVRYAAGVGKRLAWSV